MKKLFAIVSVLMVVALLPVMIGCEREDRAQRRQMTFHTGAVGGLYMESGIVFASQWERAVPGLRVDAILGGGISNPIHVSNASDPNSVVGVTDNVNISSAMAGTGDFAPPRVPAGGIQNLRALYRYNVMSWGAIIARPDAVPAGINTVRELVENNPGRLRVTITTRGSTGDILARTVFGMLGYSYEDLERTLGWRISFDHPTDQGSLMIDGHADIAIIVARVPAAFVLDMDASIRGLRWLAVDTDIQDRMIAEHGWIAGYLPMGHYTNLTQEVPSVGLDHVVFVQQGMDEELVFQMTKSVLSEPDRIRTSVPAMDEFDPSVAWTNTGFPLHPGAERAFRELGFMR